MTKISDIIKYFTILHICRWIKSYKKLLKLASALQLLLHKKDGLTSKEKTKTKQKQNKIKHDQQQQQQQQKRGGGNWRKFDILVNLIVWKGEDC